MQVIFNHTTSGQGETIQATFSQVNSDPSIFLYATVLIRHST